MRQHNEIFQAEVKCSSAPRDNQQLSDKKIDGSAMKFYIEMKIIVDPGLETDRTNQPGKSSQSNSNQ